MKLKGHGGAPGTERSRFMPGRAGVFTALILGGVAVFPAYGQQTCSTNADCDNNLFCDGVEFCDMALSPPQCRFGSPPVCNDGDACTIDYCDFGLDACASVLTSDDERAAGPDGYCSTTDDNLDLFGADVLCGTTDDLQGDGLCSAIDNCSAAYNPGQQDADRDTVGDACDPTPCRGLAAYVTDGGNLWRLDIASGALSHVVGLSDARGVAVDAQETKAFVAQGGPGMVGQVDLVTRTATPLVAGLAGPRGIALDEGSGRGYVTEFNSGSLMQFFLSGGGPRVAFGLSGPMGIDLSPDRSRAYIAEFTSGELSRVNLPGGGAVITVATGLSGPTGVAVNAAGTIAYVTEQGSGELSAIDLSSGAVTLVAAGLSLPVDLSLDLTGTIAYVALEPGGLKAVDLGTGSVTAVPMSFTLGLRGVAVSPRPPVVMSLSDTATGLPGANVTVPVGLDDVTGLGVLSADFTVEFNEAVIGATGVSPGSLASGCTVTPNLTDPGRAVISVFCSTARTGSGSLADITFNVAGARGQGSPLRFASALLNEGTPQVCADDGRFHVPVDIGGRVRYYRDDSSTPPEPSAKDVGGAVVDLSDPTVFPPGPPIGGTTTACDGTYSLANLIPVRPYGITPRKANDFDGGIDPFDAALNAQHVVGLISLTPNQRLAADVTGNGSLTSFDSARIAQLTVGLITQFPVASLNGGDWTFVPTPGTEPNQSITQPFPPGAQQGSIGFLPIIESAENQDFLGILYGDVSGNWQPPICGPSSPRAAAPAQAEGALLPADPGGIAGASGGSLDLPKLVVRTGDVIRVPIVARGAAQAISFYLDLRFDPAVLSLRQVEPGTAASRFNLTSNPQERGRARLALFDTAPLGADGEVAVATFEVIGKAGDRTTLSLPVCTVNEGRIAVRVKEGVVRVRGGR